MLLGILPKDGGSQPKARALKSSFNSSPAHGPEAAGLGQADPETSQHPWEVGSP